MMMMAAKFQMIPQVDLRVRGVRAIRRVHDIGQPSLHVGSAGLAKLWLCSLRLRCRQAIFHRQLCNEAASTICNDPGRRDYGIYSSEISLSTPRLWTTIVIGSLLRGRPDK